MNKQISLDFNQVAPRFKAPPSTEPPCQAHSETSRDAAREIKVNAGTLRLRVLEMLRRSGSYGATDDEIQSALNMNPSTQRPRRIELVKMGAVTDSKTTRPTRSGRAATVWISIT